MLTGYTKWPKEFADRYREEGCWLGETFGGVLRERAEKYGDQIAVVSGNTYITYSELDKKVDRLASGLLNLGIKPEDRVVIQLPNVIEFLKCVLHYFELEHFLFLHYLHIAVVKLVIFVSLVRQVRTLFQIRLLVLIIEN